MFWIEKYRPVSFDQILGQERVCEVLRRCAATKNLPHLVVSGPPGTGKSVSIETTLRELYGDSWQDNVTIFRTSDLMERGKSSLESDERFLHLYRSDESFLSNFKHIISSYASIRPINAEFKVMLFEDAQALSHDIQHALRRTMERYSGTCRFVFCTTQASSLIPPIKSRCLPLFFTPLSREIIRNCLNRIQEDIQTEKPVPEDEIGLIVAASAGDLRKAIMYLQVRIETNTPFNPDTLSRTDTQEEVCIALHAMKAKDVANAQKRLQDLMITQGLSGREIITTLLQVTEREYNDPAIVTRLADVDAKLTHAGNEYLQINAMVATIVAEVFS
ncbi:AAA family ATPase [Methanospirillum purgamenti]|jgi:replication factor C small subunit|uniref:Replication factor C small subunit n=1 Tax=Methanospirillum hungatei TaxID=2203 RepID=A0A8F5VL54_METHU|nr:AAA family ATPase [Methanospirillum hungatei]NLW76193.1 AAA family ATPase [Methanomicrobiales archaeon]QXO95056.1 AAA family ATPase [Methanospirillum hungatei]